MKKLDILQKIGLNKNESAIYVALLEFGPATISAVARKTGVHRPLIYKALPFLKDNGLISESPKGKLTQYVAEPPEKLEALFEGFKFEFGEMMPELKSLYQTAEKKPLVKYFEGRKGVSSVFEDIVTSLKRGDVFYRYSSTKNTEKSNSYLPPNYREIRDKKQLERFVITSESRGKTKKPRLERDMKFVPANYGLFDYDVTEIVYGNNIAFVDYNSETALVIENPIIAEFQKKLFKILYDRL